MKIVICDDDKNFISKIKSCVKDVIVKSQYSDFEYDYFTFCKANDALKYCAENKPDIVFLDIDMPEITGFDIAKAIHDKNENVLIIFVSNYDNYVYTSFQYSPFRFIRKTHLEDELTEALLSAIKSLVIKDKYIELSKNYFNEKIFVSNILYFESKGNYSRILTTDGNEYMYRSTISHLEEELKDHNFLRIHAAYLVNMQYIKKIYKNVVNLTNGQELNISRRYHECAQNAYAEYLRN